MLIFQFANCKRLPEIGLPAASPSSHPAAASPSARFHRTEITKRYVCLVHGRVSEVKGLVDANIRTLRTDATTRQDDGENLKGCWVGLFWIVVDGCLELKLGLLPSGN